MGIKGSNSLHVSWLHFLFFDLFADFSRHGAAHDGPPGSLGVTLVLCRLRQHVNEDFRLVARSRRVIGGKGSLLDGDS